MSTLVIGLTGGIGSGKSTVAELFSAKGIPVIDADQIARHFTSVDSPILNQITAYFGKEILDEQGNLNRKKLREIIFQDETKRKTLEAILHPLIREEMHRQIQSINSPYCIVMIPLLFETEPNPMIDRILVVDAPIEQQIARAQLRDQASDIKTIIDTQSKREHRLAHANEIIYNDKTLADLAPQVNKLHEFYLNLST